MQRIFGLRVGVLVSFHSNFDFPLHRNTFWMLCVVRFCSNCGGSAPFLWSTHASSQMSFFMFASLSLSPTNVTSQQAYHPFIRPEDEEFGAGPIKKLTRPHCVCFHRVLYSTLLVSQEFFKPFGGYVFFNALLLVLQALHIFWAYLILRMVYKFVFMGKVRGVSMKNRATVMSVPRTCFIGRVRFSTGGARWTQRRGEWGGRWRGGAWGRRGRAQLGAKKGFDQLQTGLAG